MRIFYIALIFLSGCSNSQQIREAGIAMQRAGHELQGSGQSNAPADWQPVQPQIIIPPSTRYSR